MKNLGCITAIAGLIITGMVVIGISLLCFGVMAGIGETIVPEPQRQGFRDWLSGIPPDDPAFIGGTDSDTSEPVPPECWEVGGWPLQGLSNGPITQHFHEGHNGVDIGVPVGTFVSAPSGGTVTWAGWDDSGYGNLVIITNGNTQFYLAHLSEPNVAVGDTVTQGDIVGLTGDSGRSTGPHLHYEIRVNGRAVNPEAVPVDGSVRCIDPQQFASAGGAGGGGELLASGATWQLPAGRRGWLLAAAVDPERAGIAPEETIVRLSDEDLYLWPAGRPDLAVTGGAALRSHDRIAVGPEPGGAWVVVPIEPAHEYLVSVWKR